MNKSISKNAIFKTILNLFNIALPIIITPIVLGAIKETYNGYISVGETCNTIFMTFACFGVSQYGLREISRVRNDEEKLNKTITSLFVITTTTTLLTTIAYTAYIIFKYNGKAPFYTCLIMGGNVLFNIFYVEWINEALENYDFIAIKTMVTRIIYSVLVIFCVKDESNYLLYLYILVGFNFINNILSFIYIRKRTKFDFRDVEIKRHLKPMFQTLILSNTYLLYTQLDRVMIDNYIGSTETGFYAISFKIMNIIDILIFTIIQVSMARLVNYLANKSKEVYMELLKKVISIYFILLFPASIGLLCVSKQAVIIFGRGYTYIAAVPILMVFSIYLMAVGIDRIIEQQIIYVFGYEKADTKLALYGGILNLILNYALVLGGIFTPTTAVVTTLIANIFLISLEYGYLVKKVIKIDIKLFSLSNMKYLLYSLIFIPVCMFINSNVENILFSCAADVICCAIIYVGILFITRDKTFNELYNLILKKL